MHLDGLIAILCALVIGYGIGVLRRLPPPAERCARVRSYAGTVTWQNGITAAVSVSARCKLDANHDGPHCVRLNVGCINEQDEWFGDAAPEGQVADK